MQQKQTSGARFAPVKRSTAEAGQSKQQPASTHHSLLHHASCTLNAAKQSAIALSTHLLLESSLPFKLLAGSWLLTNVLLPLLFINHPLAHSTLLHAFSAVSGTVLLYHILGDDPFLFTSFLSLLPLLVPQMPASYVEVEGRTVILLPRLLFPRLLPLWRQLQLVVNTVVVAAVVEHIRRYVKVGRKRAGGGDETSIELDVPIAGREMKEGEWQLGVTLTITTKRGGAREDEMETEPEVAVEGTEEKQQQEWSPEEKREREEAEYPRAPPSSPADFPMKMKVTVKEEEGDGEKRAESHTAAGEEGRGEFQSPRPQGGGARWDVKGLVKALDPLAGEHECFKPSTDTVAAPHGDPMLKAEQQQQQQQQQTGKQQQMR